MADQHASWKLASYCTLPIRFVQGWIFWGGGSRRFIYDPSKLNPNAHEWMANKLQSAMPGAILGVNHAISFLLQHFKLLYFSIIVFSLAELLCGLALIIGCCTRLAAFITCLISITLMLAFGWQGATCMDEWTMAVATLAMGITLTLSGSSVYSVDYLLRKKYTALAKKPWFSFITSGAITEKIFQYTLQVMMLFIFAFTLLTYNYYRGSIVTPYHSGPVSAVVHHLTLSDGKLQQNGAVTVTLYVDGGTPALPAYIIRVNLLDEHKQIIASWNETALSGISSENIKNIYAYNRIHTGEYGLVAPLSAKAVVTLMPENKLQLAEGDYQLVIFTIDSGRVYMPLKNLKV